MFIYVDTRLARNICAEIQERLRRSHQVFGMSLKQLELRHTDRLGRTVEQREKVAKRYAPRVARLALESRSLKDLISYGMQQFIESLTINSSCHKTTYFNFVSRMSLLIIEIINKK